jgi:large subunit ribosomal protein L17
MRHKKAGKKLSRRKEERIALARNLTRSLFEQFGEDKEFILTTTTKAKWVKPFAEKCITLGVKGYRELQKAADANGTSVAELQESHTKKDDDRKKFKDFSPKVREHLTKSIHYRRLAAKKLRDPDAVKTLFATIAPRYLERPGGYLRVLKTSKWALGDGSDRSILGFVEGAETPAAPAAAE